jgi:hypothetical protein
MSAASASEAAPAGYLGLARRLVEIGRDLLGQGLLPYEIESRIFRGLTAPSAERRIALFRAGLGLPGLLSRDEAAALATAVWRALRGEPDRVLERRMLRAHLLHNLIQAAHDGAEELRRDGCAVTPENLKSALMFAVVYARPRSELRPWDLGDAEVEKMIAVAVNEYFGGAL